jgi:transposase-like protein
MNCPFCASANVRRSRRRGIMERLTSWAGRRPYRCQICMHRFFSSEPYYPKAYAYATPLPKGQAESEHQPQVIEATVADSD